MVVKLLICGDVDGNFELLLNRINTLQSSAHGPFNVLFFTGRLFQNSDEFATVAPSLRFPMKAYAFDRTGVADDVLPADSNLEFFNASGVGLATIAGLTVAFLSNFPDSESLQDARDIAGLVGYRGCDVLLTSEWPRETHHFLNETDLTALRSTGVGLGIGSQEVASFALSVRARYHFAGSRGSFYQRPLYCNPVCVGANGQPQLSPCTRFIGLGCVSSSKDKDKKWLHALSLEPIVNMQVEDVCAVPVGATECPYAEIGTALPRIGGGGKYIRPQPPLPPGQPPSKRMRGEEPAMGPSVVSGSFFFGNRGLTRDGQGSGQSGAPPPNLIPPGPFAKTLFVGGIKQDVPEEEVHRSFPDVASVRRPTGKTYAFVEFKSHDTAKKVMDASVRREVVIAGRTVAIGWAKGAADRVQQGEEREEREEREETEEKGGRDVFRPNVPLDLTPPHPDSKVLYVGGLSIDTTQQALSMALPGATAVHMVTGKTFAFVHYPDFATADAVVKRSVGEMIVVNGKALLIGWAKDDRSAEGRVSRVRLTEPPAFDSKTLYVHGLATSVTAEDLEQFFTEVGGAVCCGVVGWGVVW